MMILVDSNIIIYAVSGKFPVVTDWLADQNMAVSAIPLPQNAEGAAADGQTVARSVRG